MAAPKTEPKIFVGIVLDFETGGLDCTKSACTQIAMHAVRMDNCRSLTAMSGTFNHTKNRKLEARLNVRS